LDSAVELRHLLHPADAVTIKEVAGNKEASVHHTPTEANMGKESGQAQLSS